MMHAGSTVQVRFLGSGDAFGSGGRLQSCILVNHSGGRFLIDCGASAMISLRRFDVEPNSVNGVFLTHLHGDHFGGLPFLILDAQLVSRRTAPLFVAGPPGLARRLPAAMEAHFPGSSGVNRKFEIDLREMEPRVSLMAGAVRVTPFIGLHPSGDNAYSLRIEVGGKVITCSGDTEWTEALTEAARDADLLIAEAYTYEKKIPFHLDYRTLTEKSANLGIRRTVITHMGIDMLSKTGLAQCDVADDGKVFNI
ncbi:MAG TPA: MBL fold metallo-hydrolase [Syntrophales bacterium]|nr:MBL fold metallo-hydrolase [Syntrophales bacterium]